MKKALVIAAVFILAAPEIKAQLPLDVVAQSFTKTVSDLYSWLFPQAKPEAPKPPVQEPAAQEKVPGVLELDGYGNEGTSFGGQYTTGKIEPKKNRELVDETSEDEIPRNPLAGEPEESHVKTLDPKVDLKQELSALEKHLVEATIDTAASQWRQKASNLIEKDEKQRLERGAPSKETNPWFQLLREAIDAHALNPYLWKGLRRDDFDLLWQLWNEETLQVGKNEALLQRLRDFISALRVVEPFHFETSVRLLISEIERLVASLEELQRVQRENPDPRDLSMVWGLHEILPRLGQRYFEQTHSDRLSDANYVRDLAKQIESNGHIALRLLGKANQDLQLTLKSPTLHGPYNRVKSWNYNKAAKNNDLGPLTNFNQIHEVILGTPGKELEENLIEDTTYVRRNRVRAAKIRGAGYEEPKLIWTVIGADVSGSMMGGFELVQAAYATSIVANCMKPSRAKAFTSQVSLVTFDKKVRKVAHLFKESHLFPYLEGYLDFFKAGHDETNTSEFLSWLNKEVLAKQGKRKETMLELHLVLMTDGFSDADLNVLTQGVNESRIKMHFYFVNFRSQNEQLKKAAENGFGSIGAGQYVFVDVERAKRLLMDLERIETSKTALYRIGSLYRDKWSEMMQALERAEDMRTRVADEFKDAALSTDLSLLNYWAQQQAPQTQSVPTKEELWLAQISDFLDAQDPSKLSKMRAPLLRFFSKLVYDISRRRIVHQGFDVKSFASQHLSAIASKILLLPERAGAPSSQTYEKLVKSQKDNDPHKVIADHKMLASWHTESLVKVPGLGGVSFGLFPGDFTKTCRKCSLDASGTISCECEREGGQGFGRTSLQAGTDCRTTFENSNGTLQCLIPGSYIGLCKDCYYSDVRENVKVMKCLCRDKPVSLEIKPTCSSVGFNNGALFCEKGARY